ncbi:nucleic acid dioxygenase ALKBH1 isoform X4 [Anopheles stephensi]|uniref:nucleic acid dioxygenase ALKBH1 isoform X4 n=1 Tax=Anopheles stephensi TaxID=30069 RepID=UPI001658B867|nr:nucleic acid dioxygenase ALKBH1 isoform X4 [Anopheles stephensi]
MFQTSFKYYKSRNPPPTFENVLLIGTDQPNLKPVQLTHDNESIFSGLYPPNDWKIYELCSRPGLLLLANPFTCEGQRYWMKRSLVNYPMHPNTTNQSNASQSTQQVQWWKMVQSITDATERKKFAQKLRWTTLGYQYDWTHKIYDETRKENFPSELRALVQYVATVLGYNRFSPEAAIVNYYPIGSTLAGHTDHSEDDRTAPLFSFSFGQPAVFLIGGLSRDEQPDAILLRSGDIIVMTGESRLCYHAVPRVCADLELPDNMGNSAKRWDPNDVSVEQHDDEMWNDVEQYIQYSRININCWFFNDRHTRTSSTCRSGKQMMASKIGTTGE